jgi:biotin carboxyl carrier protein
MRLDATVDGRTIRVEVRRKGEGYAVTLDGAALEVDLVETDDHFANLIVDGSSHEVGLEKRPDGYRVHLRDDTVTVALAEASRDGASRLRRPHGPERLTAPMPGRVVRVLAEEGREVETGQGLVVIEAMKMENELKAPRKGRVREIAVREGQAVETGALLVVVA